MEYLEFNSFRVCILNFNSMSLPYYHYSNCTLETDFFRNTEWSKTWGGGGPGDSCGDGGSEGSGGSGDGSGAGCGDVGGGSGDGGEGMELAQFRPLEYNDPGWNPISDTIFNFLVWLVNVSDPEVSHL